jgi:nitrogen fixation protein NifB
MGQRGPTDDELMELQDACAGDMNMMRHCRQCRADAVGLLGEDRGEEFTMDKVELMDIDYEAAMVKRKKIHDAIEADLESKRNKPNEVLVTLAGMRKKETRPVLMAIATSGGGVINQHFGHATEFLIYEASPTDVRFVSHRKVDLYCGGGDTCGDGETILQKIIRTLKGCEAVLCARIGIEPWGMLEEAGIQPNGEHAMEPIEEAVAAVYREMADNGQLDEPVAEPQKLSAWE